MSDPVSSAEIEDVLTSIRRLVADDAAQAPAMVAPPRRPEPSRPAGRLVLTPSLRVSPEPEEAAAPADPDEAQPKTVASPAGHGRPARQSALEARIAELEAMIGGSDGEWEPDSAGQGDYAGAPTESVPWDDGDDEPDEAAFDSPADAAPPEPRPPLRLTDPAPALPDAAEPAPEEAAHPAEDLEDEALRALIADVVREELQGELGERITRNLRKLVRREIHRVLSSQELGEG